MPSPGRRFRKILAALAIEHGAGLVTFDRDFRRYRGLRLVELQAATTAVGGEFV